MSLDDSSGTEWLFGTTESRDSANLEKNYIWRVQLDVDHNPIESSVEIMHFKKNSGASGFGTIIALHPRIITNGVHVLWYSELYGNIYYAALAFGDDDDSVSNNRIAYNIRGPATGVFKGTK